MNAHQTATPTNCTDTITTALTHPNPTIQTEGLALLGLTQTLRDTITTTDQAEQARAEANRNAAARLATAADVFMTALNDFRNTRPTNTTGGPA